MRISVKNSMSGCEGQTCGMGAKLMQERKISDNVIRRLPRYLRKLNELQANGVKRVSSFTLAEQLGLTASQIRQDLNYFGGFGLQGYGYNVDALRDEIERILGMKRGYRAILIGVGNIGHALIERFQFNDWGFVLECAFDVEPELVGTVQKGIPVCAAAALPDYLRSNQIDVAVLAVPSTEALKVAEELGRYGVKGIWNFTNVDVQMVAGNAIVENVHFSDSLLAMSYYLSQE